MHVLLESLTQHVSTVVLVLCAGLLVVAAAHYRLVRRLQRYEARWRTLLTDTRGESLETLLYDHLAERMNMARQLTQIDERLLALEDRMETSKRFVGLVRYDAFPDVAGSQSFALAVYDDKGDGAILSSIVGRNSCRVFCKPLAGGRSERDLSQEEQRAVRSAKDGGVRTILSP